MGIRYFWRVALAVVAGLVFGLDRSDAARADEGGPLVIYPYVWEGFEDYSALKNPSAFAVSRDGSVYGYSYCPDRRCRAHRSKIIALQSCEESGGVDCVIFAVKREIVADYHVLDLAATSGCPTEPSGQVAFVTDMPKPTYDFGQSIAELTHLSKIGQARTDFRDYEILGLHSRDIDLSLERDVGTAISSVGGKICAGFADSDVRLTLLATIYVANEFPKGSCLYDEVLAHEERHHKVARTLFAELAADATRRLAEDVAARPFIEVSSAAEGRAAGLARVQAALDAASIDFAQRYDIQQDEIDSDEEHHLAKVCPESSGYRK